MRYFGIIPAAGIGVRMKADLPKQYLTILDKTILEWSLFKLAQITVLSEIVIAIHPKDKWFKTIRLPKNIKITTVFGGDNRSGSVLNALDYLTPKADDTDWVLIHDAVRPLVKVSDINQMINQLENNPVGGILATEITDTLKQSEKSKRRKIKQTLDRENIWRALTPQMFRFGLLSLALRKFQAVTDESQAIELLGHQSRLFLSDVDNIKITTAQDLSYARWLMTNQALVNLENSE